MSRTLNIICINVKFSIDLVCENETITKRKKNGLPKKHGNWQTKERIVYIGMGPITDYFQHPVQPEPKRLVSLYQSTCNAT